MPSPIITVTLSEPLDAFIRDRIATGRAATASQVVQDALTLLQQHEQEQLQARDGIRRDIEVGFNQAERGHLVDGPAVFDGLLSRRRAKA